jgi:hypothetical protein
MQGGPCYDGRLRYHYMRNLLAPESPILMRQPLLPLLHLLPLTSAASS